MSTGTGSVDGGMAISRRLVVLGLGGALLFMVLFFLAPLLIMVYASFNPPSGEALKNYHEIAVDGYYARVLWKTFYMALWVTLFTFLMGYTLSYWLNFQVQSKTVRRLIYIAVVLPLFTSNIVRSFGWIVLLGRNGVINESLLGIGIISEPLQLLYTQASVIVTLSYVMLPFMILSLNSIFQNIQPSLIEASRDLGGGTFSTFFLVTFPLSLPGVVAGSLIVFTLSVSAYVTPSVMSGGRMMVMPILIYDYFMVELDFSMGATLAIMLLVASIIVIGAYMYLLRRVTARVGG